MSKSYSVYVGNLSTTVSTQQLTNLFSQVDQVVDVWINPLFKKVTYGFVQFTNMNAVKKACGRFNGLKLDFFEIKVNLSNQTKTTSHFIKPNDSILLDLPKKKGPSKNHLTKLALVRDLRENKEIVVDFMQACVEMENIAFDTKPKVIKTAPELSNLTTLETTVTRYFRPKTCKKNTVEVDIDLSKGKLLTNEQNDKFFNMQLTKPRTVKPKKPTKPIVLDYRSINQN